MASPANQDKLNTEVVEADASSSDTHRKPLSKRILGTLWDSLDKSPEERKFVAKLDWWILSYVCIAYFIKYLDQTNVSLCIIQ
jgi:MFS transporter, ACS family, pantothenate transporter